MTVTAWHVPASIEKSQALAALARVSRGVPEARPLEGPFDARLLWLRAGEAGDPTHPNPRLAALLTGCRVQRGGAPVAGGPPEQAQPLPGLWLPRWCVSAGEGAAVIDGSSGEVLAADLAASPVRVRASLVALLLLAVFAGWSAANLWSVAALLVTIPTRILASRQLVSPLVAATAGLGLVIWLALGFSRWLAALDAPLFAEPIRRVVENRLRWPLAADGALLMRRIAGLSGVTAVSTVLLAWGTGGQARPASLPLALLGALVLLVLAIGAWPRAASEATGAALSESEPWVELVRTALVGLRYALVAGLIVASLVASGGLVELYRATSARLPTPGELLENGMQLAMIAAILRAKPSPAKWPAAIALGSAFVAEKLLGTPGKIVASFVAVALTVRSLRKANAADALRAGVRFELGTALGRIIGRVVTALLLGPAAMALGEALGEQLAALRTLQPATDGPVSKTVSASVLLGTRGRVLFAGAAALALAVAIWTVRGGRLDVAVPTAWVQVAGEGFVASAPATMAVRALTPGAALVPVATEHRVVEGGLTFAIFSAPALLPDQESSVGMTLLRSALAIAHSQTCGPVILGVARTGDARCFAGASGAQLITACVVSPVGDGRLSDREAAFLLSVQLTGGPPRPLVNRAQLDAAQTCSRDLTQGLRESARSIGSW